MATATTTEAGRAVVASADAARRRAEAARERENGAAPVKPAFEPETLPDPPAAAPAKPARPASLAEAAPWLARPFPQSAVELKPTATTQDKSRALASPYVDMRIYYTRLDKICGPENWSSTIVLTERGAVCALTIFGVTKSAAGDYPAEKGDENIATSAEVQAFKRACSAFGLGRYLYSLPQVWAAYDNQKKQIVDVAGTVAQMYANLPRGEE